ncbi:MAG: hypothetical protein HYZ38_27330 [Mycobacterium sp.]|nr:hypothetical protein [Mycobacterium sp.]
MSVPLTPASAQGQAQPDRGNIRLYLRRGETGDCCYFAWFKSKGHDLYWGSAEPTREMKPQLLSGTSHQITLPHGVMDLPEVESKVSYHQSGLVHHSAGGSGIASMADEFHGHPEELSEMKLLNVVFTAAPSNLPLYPQARSLHRKRSYAMIFQLTDEQWNQRQYFEFFLSPSGPVTWPAPLYGQLPAPDEFQSHWFDIDLGRVLAVRWHPYGAQEFADWQPKVSIWIFPAGEPNTGAGPVPA